MISLKFVRMTTFNTIGKWIWKKICFIVLLSATLLVVYCSYSAISWLNKADKSICEGKSYGTGKFSLDNISYTLHPADFCERWSPEIVIMVISKPDNFHIRQAIRSTWGNVDKSNASVLFLMGSSKEDVEASIAAEYRDHGDVIQADFHDSYRNLTLKSLVMLHWMQRYCPKASFLLKSDDDVFVNVRCLLRLAKKIRESFTHNVIYGRYILNRLVERNCNSKWYVSPEEYSGRSWPLYLRGTTYLLERLAFTRMAFVCSKYSIIPMEDVVLTGLCADALNIERKSMTSFHIFQDEMKSVCNSDAITVTEVGVGDMHRLYDIEKNCSLSHTNSVLDQQCETEKSFNILEPVPR